jgi:hypothetical protein
MRLSAASMEPGLVAACLPLGPSTARRKGPQTCSAVASIRCGEPSAGGLTYCDARLATLTLKLAASG